MHWRRRRVLKTVAEGGSPRAGRKPQRVMARLPQGRPGNGRPLPRASALWLLLSMTASTAVADEFAGVGGGLAGVQSLGQVTLSLLLVVALLVVLAWAARRLNRLQSQNGVGLRIVGGLRLGARERVVVLEVADQRLLVGVSPAGMRTLLVLGEGAAPAQASAFETTLAQIGGHR